MQARIAVATMVSIGETAPDVIWRPRGTGLIGQIRVILEGCSVFLSYIYLSSFVILILLSSNQQAVNAITTNAFRFSLIQLLDRLVSSHHRGAQNY